jgi:uncharacterized protein YbjQ (UPF0145 family)
MAGLIRDDMVTTVQSLPGTEVVKSLGVVRGLTVRSRSVVGDTVGGFLAMFGGQSSIYTEMCEHARQEAYTQMVLQAQQRGANAIIGFQFESNEVMAGMTEVLAYGTAVVVR